jgi:hypothetical protein
MVKTFRIKGDLKKGSKKTQIKKGPNDFKPKAEIRSAKELKGMAKNLGLDNKAKTHKGRKIQARREAKVIENPKRSFFMKGRKSSDTINTLLKEIHAIRGTEMSKLLTKKN